MTTAQIKKEVQRQAVLFEEKCKQGQETIAIKFQALAEEWLKTYAKQNLRHSTYEGYLKYEKRIYSAIGHLRLDRITTRDIQRFINSLSQDGVNGRTGKGLSPKTIRNYNGFISGIFSYAIKMGMVTDNPCSRITLPKKNHTEKKIYTNEQTEQFLKLLQSEPLKYRLFFTVLTYSGLRKGELLGVEWSDIDWHSRVIKINRSSLYTTKKGTYTDKTKTEKSKRLVKLPLFIMSMLEQHKTEQDEERERLGSKWENFNRLFVQWNGTPMCPHTPYNWLRKFCNRSGLPFHGVHHYRHLFASLAIGEGVDIVTLSGALGHTNPNVTLGTYSHLLQNAQDKIANAVENALDFSKTPRTEETAP
ncbi:MAG: site-specific integrase [Oscillospiraceae bacterium]|nr:site-specific integrase [Oscillospiraceae bacterium]